MNIYGELSFEDVDFSVETYPEEEKCISVFFDNNLAQFELQLDREQTCQLIIKLENALTESLEVKHD